MKEPRWLPKDLVLAVHNRQLAEHGGATGVRDAGLLESALARPQNLFAHGESDAAALAGAYAFGIARNHPFVDGNKRTAAVACELFLALNDAILANRIQEIVLVAEARHEQRLAEMASLISERRDQIRVILIAGPSSSGKTTSSKRLSVQLLANGISPYPLEMDNYFVEREKTPRDEEGNFDFESINALNREQLAHDLKRLIAGERVQLPRFNFRTGTSEPGDTVQLQKGQIIIMEGIHGLHPELLPNLPAEHTFRIYISALTQLNLDRYNRVSTTDTRLLRRIVRDARERGYTAQDTIRRWESVTRGEKRNIFPYQENADLIFNSALVYELSVLRPFAEPLLRQVPFGTHEYIEAKRLLALLEWFAPTKREFVPNNSILCEFIGDSILKDFKAWGQ
ncbi:MAG: type II toxin-antitoxin system death-on-curing family toxin [Anaerolineales bacterium]|nr:type II toxin-antitoxin system death-on-curing family toxin [Anaerolineales bacterium]